MAGEIVKVTGINEVCAFFDQAPRDIVKNTFGKALTAAVVPIVEELEVRTPVSAKTEGYFNPETFEVLEGTGSGKGLRDSIVTDIALSDDGKGGIARVGFGRAGHVANFVEYGHHMIGHKPNLKKLGEVQPHPFMRPAANASADRSIEAFAATVESEMKAEGYGT